MSAVASSSGRVPQGEVIMDVSYIPPLGATNKEVELINQFADGGSYIKDKLESAVVELERKKITREEGQKASRAMEALNVNQTQLKPEDVDLIVSQTGCSRTEAQEALKLNKGDLMTTLMKLVEPRQRARSVDGGGEKKS